MWCGALWYVPCNTVEMRTLGPTHGVWGCVSSGAREQGERGEEGQETFGVVRGMRGCAGVWEYDMARCDQLSARCTFVDKWSTSQQHWLLLQREPQLSCCVGLVSEHHSAPVCGSTCNGVHEDCEVAPATTRPCCGGTSSWPCSPDGAVNHMLD